MISKLAQLITSTKQLLFSVEDKSNTLVNTLNVFGKNNINLIKIESRPSKIERGTIFFIDFEGCDDDLNVQQALTRGSQKSTFLKVLGSYKSYHFS